MWQKSGEIVLSQGKYVVEILKRFRMMDCKSMSTSMMMNLKLLGNTTSETVYATLYRKMIGSLMYDKHEARYMLCGEYFESIYG